jgi:hypothetical protein
MVILVVVELPVFDEAADGRLWDRAKREDRKAA